MLNVIPHASPTSSASDLALARADAARFGVESKLHAETARWSSDGRSLWLLRPTTFMNASGRAVAAALRYYKIEPEEMLVVHDDLDLPPGTRSEEHTSELQSLMRISYAVFCLKKTT